MEGLLKLLAIMVILYLFGWLGKRGNRWIEGMADRLKKLFTSNPGESDKQ